MKAVVQFFFLFILIIAAITLGNARGSVHEVVDNYSISIVSEQQAGIIPLSGKEMEAITYDFCNNYVDPKYREACYPDLYSCLEWYGLEDYYTCFDWWID